MNFTEKALFFQQAAKCICGSLEVEQTIGRCFQYLKEYIPLDDIWFALVEKGARNKRTTSSTGVSSTFSTSASESPEGTLRCIARADISGIKNLDRAIPLTSLLKKKLDNQNQVIVTNRMELDPLAQYFTNLFGLPESSSMVLPLLPDGIRIGAIVVMRVAGKDKYVELHAQLFAMLHDLFAVALSNALRHDEVLRLRDLLADDNLYLTRELRQIAGDKIVGSDSGLKQVMDLVTKVAPRECPVLLLGETGVGKELIANAIHYSSSRKNGPFIKVNSGAIPEGLIDSELFGHEKGAFTGAVAQKRGRFERAQRGTIFIDEIGDLPLQAQVRLLRVVQQKELERVGGTKTITVDTRIIAATHRNLEQMIAGKEFREDLWYRLNVFPIVIPPLRHRKEDIPSLVQHFLRRKSKELNFHKIPTLAPHAIDRLIDYPWKGNVRELENIVERALIQHGGGAISFDQFIFPQPDESTTIHSGSNARLLKLADLEARHIEAVLEETGGKVNGPGGAAEILGLHHSTLRLRMDKLGIAYGRKRKKLSD